MFECSEESGVPPACMDVRSVTSAEHTERLERQGAYRVCEGAFEKAFDFVGGDGVDFQSDGLKLHSAGPAFVGSHDGRFWDAGIGAQSRDEQGCFVDGALQEEDEV